MILEKKERTSKKFKIKKLETTRPFLHSNFWYSKNITIQGFASYCLKDNIDRILKSEISIFRYNEHDDSHHHMHVDMKWGWGDADMKPEEIQEVEIINKSN